jgi:hypothetical protein
MSYIETRVVSDDQTGKVIREEHFRDGLHHRDGDKPAVVEYDATSGKVISEQYWQNGRQVSPPRIAGKQKVVAVPNYLL